MIVMKLKGGLGNQMFQYAMGRSLACKLGTQLGLDISLLKDQSQKHSYRTYSLDAFLIKAEFTEGIVAASERRNFFSRLLGRKTNQALVSEQVPYSFDKKMLNLPDNSCLDGYWQSYKYFEEYEDIIRKDFTFRYPLPEECSDISVKIRSLESVSIHIRRGDYATNPETMAHHGICDLDYYKEAVRLMQGKNSKAVFFIFTDDPKWVKENFELNSECYLVSNEKGRPAQEDLHLMSLCRHAILANSSFSWWGAWLISNPKKTIIAPGKWIRDESVITTDLFPATWIRI